MCSWDVGQDIGKAAGQSVHESRAKMLLSALAKSLFAGYTFKKVTGKDVALAHQPIHYEQVGPYH
jgi:hypothetical protein